MLNCREAADRASDFVDAALPIRTRLQVQLHLLMCHLCREYVRQMALVARTLRRLPPNEPPSDLQAELLAAFRERKT
jgi:predicted anti-sigma-YlaC factor YlaD